MLEEIAVRRISAEAARRLEASRHRDGATGDIGLVHSVYARTVNIALRGGRLVSLHGPGPIPSPFGLECARPLHLAEGLEGRPVRAVGIPEHADGTVLWIGGSRLRVGLAGADAWDPRLPTPGRSDVAPLLPALREIAAGAGGEGLLPLLSRLLAGADAGSPADSTLSPLCRRAFAALEQMAAGARRRSVPAVVEAAGGLLGLGVGLTPSGDDALVGWLAALWGAGPASRSLVAGLARPLDELAATRTTRLSREFLACALRGQVAEPLGRFVNRGDPQSLAGLLACGATSGGDCLVGWVAGLQALRA